MRRGTQEASKRNDRVADVRMALEGKAGIFINIDDGPSSILAGHTARVIDSRTDANVPQRRLNAPETRCLAVSNTGGAQRARQRR
ncbi:hypothetical protein C7I87_22030 [Mesorhizobium sp. SARCC-RB16n]|nr:hypothetical protein C7I87_22030 [Mesorhizobium sp. SARCC-RB16n]